MCLKLFCCFSTLISSVTLDHNRNSNGAPTDKARLHHGVLIELGHTGQEWQMRHTGQYDPVKRYLVSLCMHTVCHVCMCVYTCRKEDPRPIVCDRAPNGHTGQEYTEYVKRYLVSLCMHTVCHVCMCVYTRRKRCCLCCTVWWGVGITSTDVKEVSQSCNKLISWVQWKHKYYHYYCCVKGTLCSYVNA